MSNGGKMLRQAYDVIEARGAVYGDALENMTRTAKLWSPVLGVEISPAQVALCLIQCKIARLIETPDHADSALDIAGYAAVLRDCQKETT